MILLDTNVLSELAKPQPDPRVVSWARHSAAALAVPTIAVAEMAYGVDRPALNVPHGMTSCITPPHAMRFMADLAPERFRPIAEGFGVPFDSAEPKRAALACANRAAAFIAQFEVPQRLRDVGVPERELPEVADVVHDVMDAAHVVNRLVTKDDLVRLLANAYSEQSFVLGPSMKRLFPVKSIARILISP